MATFLFPLYGNSSALSEEPVPSLFLHRARTLYDDTLKGEKIFHYGHENILAEITYHFNCYGLVNHLLENDFPQSLLEIQMFMESDGNLTGANLDGSNTPCPLHYIGFYQSILKPKDAHSLWQGIADFTELSPGDLVFYDSPHRNFSRPDRGQHIMIVQETHSLKENIISITFLHTTGRPTTASIGIVNGLYLETKTIQLDKNNKPTHIRWSPKGRFLRRRIGAIRLQ